MSYIAFGNKYYYNGTTNGYSSQYHSFYVQFYHESSLTHSKPDWVKCKVVCGNSYGWNWTKGTVGTDYLWLYTPNAYIYTKQDKSARTKSLNIHVGGTYEGNRNQSFEFYMFKEWDADGFTFPEFWICNQGQVDSGTFKPGHFTEGGSRDSWCTKHKSNLPYYDGWTPQSLGSGNIYVTDNYDYTDRYYYTISGTLPPTANWGNSDYAYPNSVKIGDSGSYVSYTNGNSTVHKYLITSNDVKNKSFTIRVAKNTTKMSYKSNASLTIVPTYGNSSTVQSTPVDVMYYQQPKPLKNTPKVEPCRNGVVSSKATPRGQLKFSWDIAEAGNGISPTMGCRLYLLIQKKGSNSWKGFGGITYDKAYNKYQFYDVWYKSTAGTSYSKYSVTLNSSSTMDVYITSKKCTAYIDAKVLGLAKGDHVKILIESWHFHKSRSGTNVYLIDTISDETTGNHASNSIEIESAGEMSVCSGTNAWKRGQVYVYTSSGWKASEGVYSYNGTSWKESV